MASLSASAPARWTELASSTRIPEQIHPIVTKTCAGQEVRRTAGSLGPLTGRLRYILGWLLRVHRS
jgi:hypothetical protein